MFGNFRPSNNLKPKPILGFIGLIYRSDCVVNGWIYGYFESGPVHDDNNLR